ncbi:queuosine precursor transporter [Chlamydiifrater phoenicopteri]|uniref:queuosine precursor transporter n=1 Tax=Chlamydiifrater phoenicopteri TaxID=2681469 RepID=UPI001BCB73A3|nr:queuosine precursor transporter [Chlamydiifrater phoenicopteri]
MNEGIFFIQMTFLLVAGLIFVYLGRLWVSAWVTFLTLIANIFVTKQVSLFSLDVTATDVYIIGLLTVINLFREFYGAEEARKVLQISWVLSIAYLIASRLHAAMVPSVHDQSQEHFIFLLSPALRLTMASLGALVLSQITEEKTFLFLKKLFRGRFFSARSALSMILSQVVDTVFFCFVGLYGLVAKVDDVIIMSLSAKSLGIILSMPILSFMRGILSSIKDKVQEQSQREISS